MSAFTLIGVVTGLVLAGCNVVIRLLKRRDPDLLDAVELLLATLAIGGAINVFSLAVAGDNLEGIDAEVRTFMAVGSFCVIWVAVLAIVRVFRRLFALDADDPPPDS